jgi:hypothetical protein
MTARIFFIGIAVFWVVMNALLWRQEFTGHADDVPVPAKLVWHKILTAPDSSTMTIFQGQNRIGYCELTTSVEQQMAILDEDKVPPEGITKRSGYQIHLAGNFAFEDPANRIKFDGRVAFISASQWSEINLKITTRTTSVEIRSSATNQSVHLKLTGESLTLERDLTPEEMKNPATLLGLFGGDLAENLLGGLDPQELMPSTNPHPIEWQASLTRVKFGLEYIPVFQLSTTALERTCTIDVSTLGEILRVRLPGGITAAIDEWNKP